MQSFASFLVRGKEVKGSGGNERIPGKRKPGWPEIMAAADPSTEVADIVASFLRSGARYLGEIFVITKAR